MHGPPFLPGEEMKYEVARLGTYQKWPSWGRLSATNLAPEGFYYTGQHDIVSCFACKAEVGQWDLGQDPAERHRSLAPSCPVVLRQSNNVPMSCGLADTCVDEGFQDSQDANVEHGAKSNAKGLDELYDIMPGIRTHEANLPVDASNDSVSLSERLASYNLDPDPPITLPSATVTASSVPVGPSAAALREASRRTFTSGTATGPLTESLSSMNLSNPSIDPNQKKTESYRRRTFDNGWPEWAFLGPPELAKNGFYYLESQDRVKCAFCSGILCNWRPADKAEQEHRRHFPHCPFVRGLAVGNVTMEDEMRGVQLPGNRVG